VRIKAGKVSYKAPPMGKLLRVLLDENARGAPGVLRAVEIVSAEEILRFDPEAEGTPRKCALIVGRGWLLHVWPTPTEDQRMHVRYYPPACQW
jgi:hypothetical protein